MGILLSMRKKKSSKSNISSKTTRKKGPRQNSILKYFKKEKENKPAVKKNILSRHVDTDIVEIKEDDSRENITNYNVLFYRNKLKSEPHGDYIEQILQNWHANYSLLEKHHGYIQWLFPTKECGRNKHAKPLNKEEILVISNSDTLKSRLLRAYEMMIDFYGFTVLNDQTGEVAPNKLHSKRVLHLKQSRHNHLRITRILSSLSLLGLEHITYPFLRELIHLTFGKDAPLYSCQHSCLYFWIPTVSKPGERQTLEKLVKSLKEEAIENTKS